MTAPSPEIVQAHRRGIVLLLVSTVAWSTAGLFVRLFSVDAMSSLVWRGPAAAIALTAFLYWHEGRAALWAFLKMGRLGWIYATLSSLGMLTYIPALQLTTVAHVAIIFATVPFVAAAMAYVILGERPALAAILASFVALAGVATMVSGREAASGLLGDLLAALMTCITATMMIFGRRHPKVPFMQAAAASGVLTSLAALPFATQVPRSASEFAIISASGIVNTGIGLGLFVVAAPLVPAVETALIGALEAPLAPLWVWLALGETPSSATLAGGGLVTAAVLGHLWVTGRDRRARDAAA